MRSVATGWFVLFTIVGTAFGRTEEPAKKLAVDLGGGVTMEMTLVPAGEFQMGSREPADATAEFFKRNYCEDFLNADSVKDEHPKHRVRITRPFYLGTYHVTRGQFRQFIASSGYKTDAEKGQKPGANGWNPDTKTFGFNDRHSWRNAGFEQTDDHPVVNVSWNDAVAFCAWLSKREGRSYRLPTEAEWEYACRAGTTTRYYSGDDPETLVKVGNVADAALKAQFPDWKCGTKASDGYIFTAPVGKFKPNAFGLYDMHGNAAHWCADWYAAEYYAKSPVDDPTGPDFGTVHVIRGGGWDDCPDYLRCAERNGGEPNYRGADTGFRIAMPFANTITSRVIAHARSISRARDVENLCAQGNSAIKVSDYDAAIRFFSQAIRLDPKAANAFRGRATAFRGKRDYDNSIADNSAAIRIDPNSAAALINRGRDYQEKGEYVKATADFSAAIRLNPKLVDAYANRALAYFSEGEDAKATEDCAEAIRLNSRFAQAYELRGRAYRRQGDQSKADADAMQAKRLGWQRIDPSVDGAVSVDPSDDLFIQDIESHVVVSHEEMANMRRIVKEWREDDREFFRVNGQKVAVLQESVRVAEMANNRKAIDRAERELSAALEPSTLRLARMKNDLENALALPRRAQLRQVRFVISIGCLTDPVCLGDDQMKHVAARFRELPGAGDAEANSKFLPVAVLEVLTPEQKKWIRTYRARAYVGGTLSAIRLTDDENARVNKIIDSVVGSSAFEYDWPKFEGMYRELRGKASAILTPDQQKDFDKPPSLGSAGVLIGPGHVLPNSTSP